MKVAIRLVLVFLILLTFAICIFTLFCSLGIINEQHFETLTFNFYDDLGLRAIVAIACIFVIFIIILVAVLRSKQNNERAARILTSRNGSIKISYKAVSEMIESLILDDSDVIKANVKTSKEEDGIDVLIIVFLSEQANMLKITENIKTKVEEFLTERCGVKVYDIDVLIDRIVKKGK